MEAPPSGFGLLSKAANAKHRCRLPLLLSRLSRRYIHQPLLQLHVLLLSLAYPDTFSLLVLQLLHDLPLFLNLAHVVSQVNLRENLLFLSYSLATDAKVHLASIAQLERVIYNLGRLSDLDLEGEQAR